MAPCVVLALLSTALPGAAAAATWYVSPSGSDSNGGSSSAPFKTIQKAASLVNPGDTVIVEDGIYTDSDSNDHIVVLNRGGTSGSWITFLAQNKWGSVLDGQNNVAGFGFTFGDNARYVRVEGFEIRGTAHGGFWSSSNAQHIQLMENHVHDIGRLCDESLFGIVGIYVGSSGADFTLDGNVIHHIGRLHPEDGCGYPSDFHAYKNHDHGLYLQGDNFVITNNIFYDHKSGWAIQITDLATNYDIVNNTFYGANPHREGHILLYPTTDILIQNNISYQASGFVVNPLSSLDSCPNCVIQYNLTDLGALVEPGYEQYFTIVFNLTNTDPGLVSPGSGDFHLDTGSAAIDQGLSNNAPSVDFEDTARPQGAGIDIGADELDGEAPPPDPSDLDAYLTLSPIQIDGDPSEVAWSAAASVSFSNLSLSDNQVTVWALWDYSYLYFAYEVQDDVVEAVDQNLWEDDGAEIYLDTENDKTTSLDGNDYHLLTNINGLSDPSQIITATLATLARYTMEIAIPWDVISTTPSPGKIVGLLLANNDRDNGTSTQFDWLDLIETGSYARPHLWGNLLLSQQEVGVSGEVLFSDGFESGDTSAWGQFTN